MNIVSIKIGIIVTMIQIILGQNTVDPSIDRGRKLLRSKSQYSDEAGVSSIDKNERDISGIPTYLIYHLILINTF